MTRFYFFCIGLFFLGCDHQPPELPSIDISKETPFSWKEKEPCTITFTHEGESVEMPAEIKYRGGISAQYKKNSFSLELEKKYTFPDLPKDDDWILNASYIDKTFMRHKISYDLFREMHPENIAAQSTYVDVLVNGTYNGLYLLTEEINGKRVGLNKKDSMSMLFKDPLFLYEEYRTPQDSNNYYQQKYPKIHKRDQTYFIEKFKYFLFTASDEQFAKEVGNWIDLRNVMDWHLLLLFSNNGDGIMKNFYLYKRDAKSPFQIAIWDYDHSFGRDGDNEMNMMERPLKWKRSILFVRLLESKKLGYASDLEQRWKELRDQDIFSTSNFKKKMHQIDHRIKNAVAKNVTKWPVKSYWYYDDNDYEQEKDIISSFVALRLDQLDKEFHYK